MQDEEHNCKKFAKTIKETADDVIGERKELEMEIGLIGNAQKL